MVVRARRATPGPALALLCCLAIPVSLPVHANSFTYDFDDLLLAGEPLVGQDGWEQVSTWFSPGVVGLSGGINATQVSGVVNSARGNAVGAIRNLAVPLAYTAADTAAAWQFDGRVEGIDVSQTTLLGLGSSLFGRQGTRTLLIVAGSPLFGDTLLANDWYQYRLQLDFSVSGVNSTLYYRNLVAGEAEFTRDSLLQDINLGLTPNGAGEYAFTRFLIRQDTNVGGTYIDNIQIAPVPAPPALVLLGTGAALFAARSRRRRGPPGATRAQRQETAGRYCGRVAGGIPPARRGVCLAHRRTGPDGTPLPRGVVVGPDQCPAMPSQSGSRNKEPHGPFPSVATVLERPRSARAFFAAPVA